MPKRLIAEIAAQQGKTIRQLLKESFEKHGSQEKVATALGVSQTTISLWISREGLQMKSILVEQPRTNDAA